MVQRMTARHVHPGALVDDGGLQQLGQLHKTLGTSFGARIAPRDDDGILGRREQLCRFGQRVGVANRLRTRAQFGDEQLV